ncbi:unnamed protein product [Musa acuminata subsp. burmannicoides]
MDDASIMFQCPISMEPMEDPVTIATGISYDRESIEKWLFVCKQSTCPVTMRRLPNSDLIPNHTLRRLMSSFRETAGGGPAKPPPRLPDVIDHDELVSLLKNVQTGPVRVTDLRKLRALVDKDVELQKDLIRLGGAQVLGRIMASHGVVEYWDLDDFRDRDEAVGVLALLPLSDEATVELLSKPDCVRSMMEILQSGTAEAQLRTMSILMKASKTNNEWTNTANLLLVGRTARDRRDLEEEPPEGDRSRRDPRLGRDSDGRRRAQVREGVAAAHEALQAPRGAIGHGRPRAGRGGGVREDTAGVEAGDQTGRQDLVVDEQQSAHRATAGGDDGGRVGGEAPGLVAHRWAVIHQEESHEDDQVAWGCMEAVPLCS